VLLLVRLAMVKFPEKLRIISGEGLLSL